MFGADSSPRAIILVPRFETSFSFRRVVIRLDSVCLQKNKITMSYTIRVMEQTELIGFCGALDLFYEIGNCKPCFPFDQLSKH